MGKYSYKELEPNKEIRILTLLGRRECRALGGQDSIRCILTHVPLQDAQLRMINGQPSAAAKGGIETKPLSYEAVSWTWGEKKEEVSIDVRDNDDDRWKTVSVRQNLIHVLKRLQLEDQSRDLWLDGVCIDQDPNKPEKDQQVALMAAVYSAASNVCIWLGDHKDNSDIAINFVKNHLSDLAAFDEKITDPKYSEEWKALGALMSREWFSRRWVVQEIAYAQKAIIYCGDDSVDWTDFETAVSLFERSAAEISKIFQALQTAEHDRDFFGEVAALGATKLVQAKSNLFRRDDDHRIFEYRYTLSQLVTDLSSFEAHLPHDMIYAVLSLARDTHHKTKAHDEPGSKQETPHDPPKDPTAQASSSAGDSEFMNPKDKAKAQNVLGRWRNKAKEADRKVFTVEYNQPFFEVCKQFLDFTINSAPDHFNLDIICRPWAPLGEIDLPSWIPSVSKGAWYMRKAEHAPGGQQPARKNHDPLVCQTMLGNLSKSPYNACRNQRAHKDDWYFGNADDDVRCRSLFVSGFVLDNVGVIKFPSQEGNVPQAWLDLAGWQPWDRRNRRIRTLSNGNPNSPPEGLWRTLVADRDRNGGNAKSYWRKAFEFAVDHSVPRSGLQASELVTRNNRILREFVKRLMAVVWNRRLFKSARLHLLGLAPYEAERDDYVCIIRGCSVPVILRKIGEGEESYYEFIGECYLHTMMDGKAFDEQEQHNLPTEIFELR